MCSAWLFLLGFNTKFYGTSGDLLKTDINGWIQAIYELENEVDPKNKTSPENGWTDLTKKNIKAFTWN